MVRVVVLVHLPQAQVPTAEVTLDLRVVLLFLAPALVVDGNAEIADRADDVVLAALGMSLVEPSAAGGALKAL